MRYLSIALVLLLALAVGCAKTMEGKQIDGSKTKELMAPGTNESRVVQMFGQPQQKEILPSGETKFIYYYREKGAMGLRTPPQEQQRLEVLIKDNLVQRYRYVYMEQEPILTDVPPLQPEKK
jgi:hypothetical protein